MTGPDELRADVARYFTGKLRAHGTTPRGVDWNSDAAQVVRGFLMGGGLIPS